LKENLISDLCIASLIAQLLDYSARVVAGTNFDLAGDFPR
jgi:hypothetical protein